MHDLVIRGGTIVDGTGRAAYTGDVAIDGDRIASVGGRAPRGRREIDATGLLVTPGFVDIHTHFDGQVTWDPYLTPSTWHGVTTVVMGSCGVGFAPAAPDRHAWLIGLMEGVEDIPGSALAEGIRFQWESFPEYLDALERGTYACDVGAQIPHGALRAYVMGERGAANEDATPDDISRMSDLVAEALHAGALGFSTSRTMLHRSIDGELVPGTFATRAELFGIGRALQDSGAGVFQVAIEHAELGREVEWMRELARSTGRPVSFNLSQLDQAPDLWRQGVAALDDAHRDGVPLFAQVAGRAIGIVFTLQGTGNPLRLYRAWHEIAALPFPEQLRHLRDPAFRARLLAETPLDIGPFETFVATSWHKMFPLSAGYEPAPSDSVAALAARAGCHPLEVVYDALLADGGTGKLYFPLYNYAGGDLAPLHRLHQHPRTIMGLSDAGAHCGAICDGGMPTFMLTHWTRDRTRGPKLGLEHVVRRQTRETAAFFGLHDRGVLAPGMKADVNVIDYATLALRPAELVFDLPAGGRRLLQRPAGYAATVLSGKVVLQDDESTGELPGRILRGTRAAPAAATSAA